MSVIIHSVASELPYNQSGKLTFERGFGIPTDVEHRESKAKFETFLNENN